MRKNRVHMYHSNGQAHSVESFKRRRALPLDGQMRFFERILSVRKFQELVFITKTVAKNR